MSYLAKIKAKSVLHGTDKTDKTSSVSFGSTPQGTFPEKKDGRDRHAAIEQALAAAVAGLPITRDELRAELSAGDVASWHAGGIGAHNLRALAQAVHDSREREAGRVPTSYEDIATCARCGPVWLFTDGELRSCPWCINRMAGLPIPRPALVTCIDCRYFERGAHLHMGRCGAGVPSGNPTGQWWDTDRHGCARWLPDRE